MLIILRLFKYNSIFVIQRTVNSCRIRWSCEIFDAASFLFLSPGAVNSGEILVYHNLYQS